MFDRRQDIDIEDLAVGTGNLRSADMIAAASDRHVTLLQQQSTPQPVQSFSPPVSLPPNFDGGPTRIMPSLDDPKPFVRRPFRRNFFRTLFGGARPSRGINL